MNTQSFILLMKEFGSHPSAVKKKGRTEATTIDNNTSMYSPICREFIEKKSTTGNAQFKLDRNKVLLPTSSPMKTSNSLIAASLNAIDIYPEHMRWKLSHLVKFLNVVEFDCALYVFRAFYIHHSGHSNFYKDLEEYIETAETSGHLVFFKNLYQLCRLFSLDKVNSLRDTDIIIQLKTIEV